MDVDRELASKTDDRVALPLRTLRRREFLGITVSAPASILIPTLTGTASCTAANDNHLPRPPATPGSAAMRPPSSHFPNETRDQSALWEAYGDPLDFSNIVAVRSPYPLTLAFPPYGPRRDFHVHWKVADSLGSILQRVLEVYGRSDIARLGLDKFGGDHVDRPMRGTDRWSMHAWGIAIDFDPANNRYAWSKERARFAGPDYADWWRIWQAAGWYSLGMERDFDWMHVQAARRTY